MVKHVISLLILLMVSFNAHAANRTTEILTVTAAIFIISGFLASRIVKKKKIKETPVKILTFGVYFWVIVFVQAFIYSLSTALI